MLPVVEFLPKPAIYMAGPAGKEPVAIVATTTRQEPDEGLILWGFRPHNGGIFGFRHSSIAGVLEAEVGAEYRPAYRKVVGGIISRPFLWMQAGDLLQKEVEKGMEREGKGLADEAFWDPRRTFEYVRFGSLPMGAVFRAPSGSGDILTGVKMSNELAYSSTRIDGSSVIGVHPDALVARGGELPAPYWCVGAGTDNHGEPLRSLGKECEGGVPFADLKVGDYFILSDPFRQLRKFSANRAYVCKTYARDDAPRGRDAVFGGEVLVRPLRVRDQDKFGSAENPPAWSSSPQVALAGRWKSACTRRSPSSVRSWLKRVYRGSSHPSERRTWWPRREPWR